MAKSLEKFFMSKLAHLPNVEVKITTEKPKSGSKLVPRGKKVSKSKKRYDAKA